jgi:hypothetical protein
VSPTATSNFNIGRKIKSNVILPSEMALLIGVNRPSQAAAGS